MMKQALARPHVPSLWVLFAAAALGGLALVVLSFSSLRSYEQAADTTLEAAEVLGAAAVLFTQIQDAESSQRAYLLTGDQTFLDEFQEARESIPG